MPVTQNVSAETQAKDLIPSSITTPSNLPAALIKGLGYVDRYGNVYDQNKNLIGYNPALDHSKGEGTGYGGRGTDAGDLSSTASITGYNGAALTAAKSNDLRN